MILSEELLGFQSHLNLPRNSCLLLQKNIIGFNVFQVFFLKSNVTTSTLHI